MQPTPGSYKCSAHFCQVGKNIKKCYDELSLGHVTKETFKINHYFDCNSKCLIYLLSCKVCGKHYVGSAK